MLLKETIGVFKNAFTPEECETLIKRFESAKDTGKTWDGNSGGGGVNKDLKITEDFNLLGSEVPGDDKLEGEVINRFNTILTDEYLGKYPHLDVYNHHQISYGTYYEVLQMQKYIANEGHYNAWHTEKESWGTSRRMFVFILYLNTVEKGGKTEFLFKENDEFYGVSPEQGALLIHPASWPYVHRGEMPYSNDKYILTSWLSYDPPEMEVVHKFKPY